MSECICPVHRTCPVHNRTLQPVYLRLWTCTDHDGYYPVGTASIVLAETEEAARELLRIELIDRNLLSYDFNLTEVPLDKPQAVVLRDGDY